MIQKLISVQSLVCVVGNTTDHSTVHTLQSIILLFSASIYILRLEIIKYSGHGQGQGLQWSWEALQKEGIY